MYGLGLIGEETAGSGYRSYHFDFRGSTVALTNEREEVVERFGYGPYGELVAGETSVTPFLFNGRYGVITDPNGLYFMRARFYSPEIKRFVNRDVLLGEVGEGQSLNRFAFVSGRPISLVDPFGLSAEDIFYGGLTGFIGFMAGAAIGGAITAMLPLSAPAMTAIAIVAAGTGGFMAGVNLWKVLVQQNYWTYEKLSPSEVDSRIGHVFVDLVMFGAGGTWFRIGCRDPKRLADWEFLKLPPAKRWKYEQDLSYTPDFEKIQHLSPGERNLRFNPFSFWGASRHVFTGPGLMGRYAWPMGIVGMEAGGDCILH